MRRRRKPRRATPQLNVLPFVDVTLVLLVIFMTAAAMLGQSLAVNLPLTKTAEAVPESADHLILTLRANGELYLDALPVAEDELPERLAAAVLAPGKTLYLRADRDIPYGDVVRIMDRIRRCGVPAVNLVTEKEDRNE